MEMCSEKQTRMNFLYNRQNQKYFRNVHPTKVCKLFFHEYFDYHLDPVMACFRYSFLAHKKGENYPVVIQRYQWEVVATLTDQPTATTGDTEDMLLALPCHYKGMGNLESLYNAI